MRRRIGIVIVAIALAIVGTVAVLAYVRQADQRALAGQKGVTVLVAADQIPAGTSAGTAMQDGLLTGKVFPASSVPSDAVTSVGPGLSDLVLSAALAPGELLTRSLLVTSVQSASGLAVPRGMIAVTLQLCLPQTVAGNIHAGSRVAVFDTYPAVGTLSVAACSWTYQQGTGNSGNSGGTGSTGTAGSAGSAGNNVRTRLVLSDVQVLAVGQAGAVSGTNSGSGLNSGLSGSTAPPVVTTQGTELVTFAVSQADAERLIDLTVGGLPYLAIVTPNSGTAPDTRLNPLFNPVP